ncbi:2-amino-4-hydroxy-6-hydroxymethyldihydropteridine diphosphokinase [Shewanella sp. 202IG2-18]|uniref:2-amino-4-hydroxy-6- hydroxymethyldihydropteridine diphosphokinase n=1 Tax=Parashewanella hymeniacidonis TaxID=2807618 RepID=UPI001961F80E|nr:2-amino-4-hydroxy-6-hydroxymethyldihydropteridine diphosphokinase [Parashewanella hymeniacidonis]MBM7072312.1 2-amino-4-hydroxy-6-hydroxymethyldihydropteridine diphosphokinase [Parashewanella hymeniacidonis]
MTKVFIALGANLRDPVSQLNSASMALAQRAAVDSLNVSPYYASVPMGDVEQPDYVNAVASFETNLDPIELLDALQNIENQQGRVREVRWGPRTLDLDILLYGNQIIQSERLIVPHYGMKQRSFVLIPLHNIAPNLTLPCGTTVASLINVQMKSELQQLDIDRCSN